jgi:hypothetical protein
MNVKLIIIDEITTEEIEEIRTSEYKRKAKSPKPQMP